MHGVVGGVGQRYEVAHHPARLVQGPVPWQATRGQLLRSKGGDARVEVPVLLDEELSQGEAVSVETVDDVPVSFSQAARLYSARRVVRELWRVTNPHYDGPGADHDPMALLGEG